MTFLSKRYKQISLLLVILLLSVQNADAFFKIALIFMFSQQSSISLFLNGALDVFLFPFIMFYPMLACTVRVYLADLDLVQFDRYSEYFQDDSVLTLAQAGDYIGAKNIEEYVKFVDADFNPFYVPIEGGKNGLITEELAYLDYVDGQCIFSRLIARQYQVSDMCNGDLFTVAAATKVFFDYSKRYFTRFNVYYPAPSILYNLGQAIPPAAGAEFICNTLQTEACQKIVKYPDDCLEQVMALPFAEGQEYYFDSNSRSCRIVHAGLARQDPVLHCPHIALEPTADPNGVTKCYISKKIQISHLFSPEEIAQYESFAAANSIDPDLGYIVN